MTNNIDLANLGAAGFAIYGAAANDWSGLSVSSAGDVNNDGYDDIIIGTRSAAPSSRSNAGISYVIYGGTTNYTSIDLANIGTRGFEIWGAAAGDESGSSVSSAGDVNNDGYDDIIIGAYAADPSSRSSAGISYVIYGGTTNYTSIDLANIGTRGFEIWGAAANDNSGRPVSSAGDMNNDGYDDIIIGARYAAPSSRGHAGTSYVIYGGVTNNTAIDLANIGTRGFAILGSADFDYSGSSVSSAGDVNNDGYDDIIIGAYNNAGPSSRGHAGTSYVIYGGTTNNTAVDLLGLDAVKGFAIHGAAAGDYSGTSVSSAGDVNNDGYDDIIIGALNASPSSRLNAGISYLIYGGATTNTALDLLNLGTKGFAIYGAAAGDISGKSVSSAGDVNNDGYDDIIIGAFNAAPSSRSAAGTSYVIYGGATNYAAIDLLSLGTKGFALYGAAAGDYSGSSVSSAGDVNNDGYADIIIGAYLADPSSRYQAGTSYVIYGGPLNFASTAIPTLVPTSNPTIILQHNVSENERVFTVEKKFKPAGGKSFNELYENANGNFIYSSNRKAVFNQNNLNSRNDLKNNQLKTSYKASSFKSDNSNNLQTTIPNKMGNVATKIAKIRDKIASLKQEINVNGEFKNNEPNKKTPIGMSLSENIEIELVEIKKSNVTFDYSNDGNYVRTSWVGPKDAILVYDHNSNINVDKASEIVLTQWCLDANTDFEALLCNFDTNKDKIFNKQDLEFMNFYIWQDKNQDGISQDDELTSLEQAGIIAIDFNTQEEIQGELRELGALNKAEVMWSDGGITYAYDLVFYHD